MLEVYYKILGLPEPQSGSGYYLRPGDARPQRDEFNPKIYLPGGRFELPSFMYEINILPLNYPGHIILFLLF